jgi:hypothetical protein
MVLAVPSLADAPHTIKAVAGKYGSIEPSGNVVVQDGSSQSFTITPDPGSAIIDLTVDGRSVGPVPSYTFYSVNSDHTIRANFDEPAGSVMVRSDPRGAEIILDGTTTGERTDSIIEASPGHHQVTLVLDGFLDETFSITAIAGKTTLEQSRRLTPGQMTTVPTTITTTVPTTVVTTVPTTIKTTVPTTLVTPVPTTITTTVPTTLVTTVPTTIKTTVPTTLVTTVLTTSATELPTLTTTTLSPIYFEPTTGSFTGTTAPTQSGTQTNLTTLESTTSVTSIAPTLEEVVQTPIMPATTNEYRIVESTTPEPPIFILGPFSLPVVQPAPGNTTGIPFPRDVGGIPVALLLLIIAAIPLTLLAVHDIPPLLGGIGRMSAAFRVLGAAFYIAGALAFLYALLGLWENGGAIRSPLIPAVAILIPVISFLALSSLTLGITTAMGVTPGLMIRVHTGISLLIFLTGAGVLFSSQSTGQAPLLVLMGGSALTSALALFQSRRYATKDSRLVDIFPFFRGSPDLSLSTGSPQNAQETFLYSDEAALPEQIRDRYCEVELLGLGGISRVFRARRLSDGALVAVKIPISADEATGRCFMKEIMAWEGLRHPNIVEIAEVNILPVPFVEMEYARSTLADLKFPIMTGRAVVLIAGIAGGLAYAHDRGIIHRDIKPHNVLLTAGDIPKITDWGMSQVKGSCIVSTVTGFSLAYAAPEQVNPGLYGETDERTDIYQLGVLFYEIITGKIPFIGDDLVNVSTAIVQEPPVPPSHHNPRAKVVEEIILKCLAKDPAARYQSVHDLLDDLERVIGHELGPP